MGTPWRGQLSILQLHHHTWNAPLLLSAILSRHIWLQKRVDGKGTVSIAYVCFQHKEEGQNRFASTCRSKSKGFRKGRRSYLQGISPSSSLKLGWAAKESYQKLLFAIKSVCNICDVLFQQLLDAVEQSGEVLTEEMDAVLSNPCNKTCQVAQCANSDYERLGSRYMSVLVVLLSVLRDLEAHVLFYDGIQTLVQAVDRRRRRRCRFYQRRRRCWCQMTLPHKRALFLPSTRRPLTTWMPLACTKATCKVSVGGIYLLQISRSTFGRGGYWTRRCSCKRTKLDSER